MLAAGALAEPRGAEGARRLLAAHPDSPGADARLVGHLLDGPGSGGHEIFDFLKRDPADLVPTFAVAEEISEPLSLRTGKPGGRARRPPRSCSRCAARGLFSAWRRARRRVAPGAASGCRGRSRCVRRRQGLGAARASGRSATTGSARRSGARRGRRPATVIRMPVTFPPESFPDGRLLSGLGVPDLSGRIGRPTYYTSGSLLHRARGQRLLRSTSCGSSRTPAARSRWIAGPPGRRVRPRRDDRPAADAAGSRLPGPAHRSRPEREKRELAPGQWSDWVSLEFRVNPLIALHGYARFRLETVSPEIAPLPLAGPVRSRAPAARLRALLSDRASRRSSSPRFGRYKTMGWAIDTWSIQSGTLHEDAFLEDVARDGGAGAADARRRSSRSGSASSSTTSSFPTAWRTSSGGSATRSIPPTTPRCRATLRRRRREVVRDDGRDRGRDGEARCLPEDVLIVLSDHGFATWRRSVNYNSWLVENGYLRPDGRRAAPEPRGALLARAVLGGGGLGEVAAYAMGLGDVYVNLKGRETERDRRAGRRRTRRCAMSSCAA